MQKTILKKIATPKKSIVKKNPDPVTLWDSKQKAIDLAKAILDKKGEEISLLCVSELSTLTDYYLICSANSEPHIWAIVDAVETALKKHKLHPLGIEGGKIAPWVLVDCSDVIVHIFKEETRKMYDLDGLWADAKRVSLHDENIEQAVVSPPKTRKKKAL
jgi:ribosome-associated protein